MNRRLLRGAAALTFILAAGVSARALTADALWDSLQKQYASYGYQISAAPAQPAPDGLTIGEVVLTRQDKVTPKEGADPVAATTAITIPDLRLTERADGSVAIGLPPEITVRTVAAPDGGDTVSFGLTLSQQGLEAAASGEPDALTFTVKGPSAKIALANAGEPANSAPPVTFEAALSDIDGQSASSRGASGETQTTRLKIGALTLTGAGTDAETSAQFSVLGKIAGLSVGSTSVIPTGLDRAKIAEAVAQGGQISFSGVYGPASLDFSESSGPTPTTFRATAASGGVEGAMTPSGLRYSAHGEGQRLELAQSPDPTLPAPASLDVGRAALDFAIPLAASAAPQPFDAKLSLDGVSVSDNVWALVDPNGRLPRDPAALDLDLGGTARLDVDLLSPDRLQPTLPPVTLESAEIRALRLSVAGLTFDGKGSATIDNSGGAPVPSGAVDLNVAGVGKLMDNLVAIGLIEQQQTMMVRMLLGLYAKPVGDDAYSSRIEMKPTGEILANGQRIR